MDKNMSIQRTYDDGDYTCEVTIEVEKIENGFLVTKRKHKYPKEGMREKIPYDYKENNTTKKKYYEKNPLQAGPIWDKVKF